MPLRYAIALLLFGPSVACAQNLTAAECDEILSAYNIVPDGCAGSGAVRASDGPTQRQKENNVFFAQGGSRLDPKAREQIVLLGKLLESPAMARSCLRLEGHSDTSGSSQVNRDIARKRAETVNAALARQLANPGRILEVTSRGEETPLANLSNESPWQRRVTLWARNCPLSS